MKTVNVVSVCLVLLLSTVSYLDGRRIVRSSGGDSPPGCRLHCKSGYRLDITTGDFECACVDPCEVNPCKDHQHCKAVAEPCAFFCTEYGCNPCYEGYTCVSR